MFKRKVMDKLLKWKNEYSSNYSCLLEGPRRVGKSTIAETFAKENYESCIIVDFAHIPSHVKEAFDDINDLDIFFLRLQEATRINLIPHKSVIVFEEIQLAPLVRQAIKYLVKDSRYSYIETGSFININKNIKGIVIPSEEMKINVNPMDYEEFCWATNTNYDLLKKINLENKPLGQAINRKLMRDFRIYMAVGGMPQAVEGYINKLSFQQIDTIKQQIIELYQEDFRKIDRSGKISLLYNSIPGQLANNRIRFVMSSALNKQRITEKDNELLSDLINSRTVIPCYNVTDPTILLSNNLDMKSFKLYLSDVGLFTSMVMHNKELATEDLYLKLLSDNLPANLGYLYENSVAQILNSNNQRLFFHTWKKENSTHSYEIDFLVTDKAKLIPIEVKSSERRNHESIDTFSQKYSKRVSRRILFSQDDIGHDNMLELKPIYLSPIILENLSK